MKEDIRKEVEFGEGVNVNLDRSTLKISASNGEVIRNLLHPKIQLSIDGNKIILEAKRATKREKTILGSFESHVKNMVIGVQEPHVYRLKICSGHFPMNVSMSGQELIIKNFLGESVPRKVLLSQDVKVKINGTEIEVKSPDKEVAGQSAAKIESLCKITGRDKRIFQDGCYIVHKAGRDL